MVALSKNWSFDVNNVVPQTTVEDLYQELFLQLHNTFKNAGYTVAYSSNGTTADASDNVLTKADVVVGNLTSTPRTWILYDPPATAPDSDTWQILIEPEVINSAPSQNQGVKLYSDFVGFDTSAAATGTLPTPNDEQALTVIDVLVDIRYWSTTEDSAATWHAMWSDEGDLFFITRARGMRDAFAGSILFVRTDTAERAGTPDGNLQIVGGWSASNSTTFPVIPNANLPCVCFNRSGKPSSTANATLSSVSFDAPDTWTDGLDERGRLIDWPCYWSSSAAQDIARYLGIWTDIRTVSDELEAGWVEDGDTDPVRYIHLIHELLIPWPSDGFPVL
jgi:hypothetical protein